MASMSAAQNRTPAGIALPQTDINWDRYYLSVSTFLIWCEEASGRRVWSIMKTGLTHHEEGFEALWIRVWSIVNKGLKHREQGFEASWTTFTKKGLLILLQIGFLSKFMKPDSKGFWHMSFLLQLQQFTFGVDIGMT
jgi:hypothetical protein